MADDSWIHYLILGVLFFGGLGAIGYMHFITRDIRREMRDAKRADRAHPAE
jgi:hypothetical protein